MNNAQRSSLKRMLSELDVILDSKKLTSQQDVYVYEARSNIFYAIGTDVES